MLQWSVFYNNVGPSKEAVDLPSYLWALRHTNRQAKQFSHPSPGKYKSIYDTNVVRGVFSHGSLTCVSGEYLLIKKIFSVFVYLNELHRCVLIVTLEVFGSKANVLPSFPGVCRRSKLKAVPFDTAFLGHFKGNCNEECMKNIVHDLTLQKYKEQVNDRVLKMLSTLHLL